ncbi:MAG TPA: hypothetical protein VFJ97_01170 [Dermatophilaceae bacterium]|nr:hypothetical protein [Dermatophilaceae bacterium]
MSEAQPGRPQPHRPVFLDPAAMEATGGAESLDPARVSEVAHETAAVIVRTGRAADDPALTARLVSLVDDLGLSTLAELWADRPARSLPGALWRLYALREWVRRDPAGASADYGAGVQFADLAHVVAGVAEPPGPEELRELTDAILTGVFDGDLAVALERAAAFCRVVSAGRAHRADEVERTDPSLGTAQTRRAASMLTTADDLQACARLWRKDDLL